MSLSAGMKLGPYEITATLGAGGMGEVYRAKDTRLDRAVAIKVLPGHLSDDPERKARFDREARAISQLTHPNICTLHDVGHQDGTDYLVMELLEGETLAARLSKGALPLDQVLRFGREIASALDKAHRSGVIHRDLKPGNVVLTKSGAKLLDFGLAKGVPLASSEPTALTLTQPLTSKGTLVGTFQYMAPEQLEGKEADARTDIFAFGAVLYEMATGRRAFEGKSQASLIAAIMHDSPAPISQIHPMTPPSLDHLVRSCLAKEPDDRLQTAHDIGLQLQWIAEAGSQAGTPAPHRATWRSGQRFWVVSTLGLLALSLSFGYLLMRRAPVAASLIRASIPAPEGVNFITVGDFSGPVAVAPDGSAVVFTGYGSDGTLRLWVRPLASDSAKLLPGTEGATFPFWSPDSRAVGFFTSDKMRTVEVAGGPPTTVCAASGGRGGTWNKDGVIVFSPNFRGPLYRVRASGGEPTELTPLDESKHDSHRWPAFCSDGKHFVYLAVVHGASEAEDNAIFLGSLDGTPPRLVMRTSANAVPACDRLLFMREGSLLASSFDVGTGRLVGESVVVATGVTYDVSVWRGGFSSSQNGVLAFHAGQALGAQSLVRFDRSGKELGRVGEPEDFTDLRLSPDGKRVTTSIAGRSTDIWVYDMARGTKMRISFEPGGSNVTPCWSSDGRSIIYGNV
ncbi:MAG TPA: protein kinase, partial [Phycisphaerae bacterium]|nr:protein kinase [Phycisphaerae bacterium]